MFFERKTMAEQMLLVKSFQGESQILEELTTKISQILNHTSTPINQETIGAPSGIKLGSTIYGLWFQVVEMYISKKSWDI